jgi:hypothetical protein
MDMGRDRDRDKCSGTQIDRDTNRLGHKRTGTQMDKDTDKGTWMDRDTIEQGKGHRQTGTEAQIDRNTDGQGHKGTGTQTDRDTDMDRDTEMDIDNFNRQLAEQKMYCQESMLAIRYLPQS